MLNYQPFAFKLAISPDGSLLASTGLTDKINPDIPNRHKYRQIVLWDLDHQKLRTILKGHPFRVSKMAFSPDGNTLAAKESHDYSVILWDTSTGKVKARIQPFGNVTKR